MLPLTLANIKGRENCRKQNTVTFIVYCCHQMREGILPPQSSNKKTESLKVSMLSAEFILRLGSKGSVSASCTVSGLVVVSLCDKCWVHLITSPHSLFPC